ncbi:glycosyltransferase family 4 protein [Thermodesulfobacteriota bacterium]
MVAYTFYENDGRVIRYAQALRGRGDEVDVISLRRPNQSDYDEINQISIYRVQTRHSDEKKGKLNYLVRLVKFLIRSSRMLMRLNKRHKYDLIHVHSVPDFQVFAAWWCKLRGSKIILDIHDIVPEFYASKFTISKDSLVFKMLVWVERASIAFSDHVIIANDIWKERLLSRSVKNDKKCTSIINYPDTAMFKRDRPVRKSQKKFVLLYPGTINHHQGLDIAVKAFSLIKNEIPEAEFQIYGEGPDKEKIKVLINELRLNDRIEIMDPLPILQIIELMSKADLGIVPKRSDGFGDEAFSTKTMEFMALGVPVVISNTKIDRYYFNEDIAFFFNSGDERDLAQNILNIYQNEALRHLRASNALAFIENNNWEIKKKIYFNIVDRIREMQE